MKHLLTRLLKNRYIINKIDYYHGLNDNNDDDDGDDSDDDGGGGGDCNNDDEEEEEDNDDDDDDDDEDGGDKIVMLMRVMIMMIKRQNTQMGQLWYHSLKRAERESKQNHPPLTVMISALSTRALSVYLKFEFPSGPS